MKRFFVALTALGLATGAAHAANMGLNERPGEPATFVQAEQTSQVRARDILSPRELHRRGIPADAVLTVTSFPTSDAPTIGNDKH